MIDLQHVRGPNVRVRDFALFTGLSDSYIRLEIKDGRLEVARYGRGAQRSHVLILYASARAYALTNGFLTLL